MRILTILLAVLLMTGSVLPAFSQTPNDAVILVNPGEILISGSFKVQDKDGINQDILGSKVCARDVDGATDRKLYDTNGNEACTLTQPDGSFTFNPIINTDSDGTLDIYLRLGHN